MINESYTLTDTTKSYVGHNISGTVRIHTHFVNGTNSNIVIRHFHRPDKKIYKHIKIPPSKIGTNTFDIYVTYINENDEIVDQFKFSIPYELMKDAPIRINELGYIIALEKFNDILFNNLVMTKKFEDHKTCLEDDDISYQYAIFGNDPEGKLQYVYSCINGYMTKYKLATNVEEEAYIRVHIKHLDVNGNTTVTEWKLTDQQLIELQNQGYLSFPIDKGVFILGITPKDTEEGFKRFIEESHYMADLKIIESTYEAKNQTLKHEITRLEETNKSLQQKLETIKISYDSKVRKLETQIEKLETENNVLRKKLEELSMTAKLSLEDKQLEIESKKLDTSLKKAEITTKAAEVKKEVEEVKKDKEIKKSETDATVEKIRVEKEKVNFTKELYKTIPVALTSFIAIYAITNNQSRSMYELLNIVIPLPSIDQTLIGIGSILSEDEDCVDVANEFTSIDSSNISSSSSYDSSTTSPFLSDYCDMVLF